MKIKNPLKVLIIGLDGATFDVISPMLKDGKLPTIGKIMKEGTWGELESTIPPQSAPAWTFFMTGKNPGKHGVYDWFEQDPLKDIKNIDQKLITSHLYSGTTFLDLFSYLHCARDMENQ